MAAGCASPTRLRPAAGAQLAALLHPATAHPWPELLPPHPYGGGRTAYTRVTPEVVVELSVDLALERASLAASGAVYTRPRRTRRRRPCKGDASGRGLGRADPS